MSDSPALTALLVVADEARRYALDPPLRTAGFNIRGAVNGLEGLRAATELPDIILLDLRLPDMTGYEVCCRLKAHAATAMIPVLHLSDAAEGHAFDGHVDQGDEAYLTYPVDGVELLSTVRALLRGRQVQRQFGSFLEAAPDAVVIADQDGRIVRVNGQAEAMFGRGRVELIGRDVEVLLPERYRDTHRDQRAGYTARPTTRPMGPGLKLWGVRKGGAEFPVEISLSPILDHGGLLVASVIRDVTDRSRTEAALQDSETRYRRLFETAKDGVLILDTESGRITDANPFMSDLLGYSHDHFLGQELWEIGLFRDKAANEAAVRTLQDTGYIRYEHLPLETSRGVPVEVEVVANAYREGAHGVIQCNVRDITERSRLQRRVEEQAAVLADLDRRKDEFLATLAHELRNPLAPIRNSLEIMRRPGVGAAAVERSRDVIERQVQQMVRLVDDLMDVSRIVQGKVELRPERVELAAVVARAVETARPVLDAKGHDLAISMPTESLRLEADVVRLAQVVGNLLTNAAKYTEPGGRIRLTAERDGDEAVLRVADTGIGIAPDMLPKVFDLFVQVDPTATRSQGGLGIGLMLVKNLAGLHRGTVEAHSGGLGTGSEFVVRLPLARPGRGVPDAPGEVGTPDGVRPGRRLLVVDDNVDAAESLATLLGLGGHEVRVAHSGTVALAVVKDYRPEMVILDIGMPGLDGYEVARRLRGQPGLGGAVLVALTGWGSPEDRRRTTEAGFDHHLVKPVELAVLETLLAGLPSRT